MTDENSKILNDMFGNKNNTAISSEKDHIICIVDRSGSMSSIREEAQGGLNAFIQEQKEVDNGAYFTLVEFDNEYDQVCDRVDIKEAREYKLVPRGLTALYDAIGRTLNGYPDVDGKKIVVIVTDGVENASYEYTSSQISKMITEKQDAGWEFIFLAANQNAVLTARSLGISADAALNFTASAAGATQVYAAATEYTRGLRTKSKTEALADLDLIKSMSSDIS